MGAFKIWKFELKEVTYNGLLRTFHCAGEIVQIKGMFKL